MKKFAVAYHINSGTNGIFFVVANDKSELTKEKLDKIVKKDTTQNGMDVPVVVIDKSTDYNIEEIGENMKSPYSLD